MFNEPNTGGGGIGHTAPSIERAARDVLATLPPHRLQHCPLSPRGREGPIAETAQTATRRQKHLESTPKPPEQPLEEARSQKHRSGPLPRCNVLKALLRAQSTGHLKHQERTRRLKEPPVVTRRQQHESRSPLLQGASGGVGSEPSLRMEEDARSSKCDLAGRV